MIKAVNAGTDFLVFSNVFGRDPELGPKIHAVIADAVREAASRGCVSKRLTAGSNC